MFVQNPLTNELLEGNLQTRFAAIIFLLGWISVAVTLIGLSLFLTVGEQFTPVRLVSYVAPLFTCWLILLAIPAILLRKGILAILLLTLAVPLVLPFVNLFDSAGIKTAVGQTYKVMTYSKMGRNHNIDSVAQVVLSEKPDLLFVQEIDERETISLIKLLSNIYDGAPVFYFTDERNGLILSRWKVNSLQKKNDFSQAAEIEFPKNSWLVWNVHLQKSFGNTDQQYKMVDQLAEQIASADSPVIVAGDFNATVVNYPYKKIRQHLDNAFENAGSGFGFTFPSPARHMGIFTPFMRIDHIFYSSQFNVHNACVVRNSGDSDHYPVVALVSLKKD